jgi:hypothetical protein
MRIRRVAVLAVVAACAVVWCGCGAAGGGADRRVRLPAALPADVPLPAGAALRTARDLGSKGLNLVFETDEPVAAVERQLRSRLESGGWTLLSEVVVESAVFSSYRKQARSVALGISRTGGVTVVGLAYYQPEPEREGAPG